MARFRALVIPALAAAGLVGTIGLGSAAAQSKTARGTVTAASDSSLTVKAGTEEMTFAIDKDTAVLASGAGTKTRQAKAAGASGIKLTDVVKVGTAVAVMYTGTGGAMKATEVRSVPSAGAGGGSPAAAPADKRAAGKVKSVSAAALTVTDGGKDWTFGVNAGTEVLGTGAGTATAAAGGRTAITNLVGVGDTVTVMYKEAGTAMTATSVRVTIKSK